MRSSEEISAMNTMNAAVAGGLIVTASDTEIKGIYNFHWAIYNKYIVVAGEIFVYLSIFSKNFSRGLSTASLPHGLSFGGVRCPTSIGFKSLKCGWAQFAELENV